MSIFTIRPPKDRVFVQNLKLGSAIRRKSRDSSPSGTNERLTISTESFSFFLRLGDEETAKYVFVFPECEVLITAILRNFLLGFQGECLSLFFSRIAQGSS